MTEYDADYAGPTVRGGSYLVAKMDPKPICATCPLAQWYKIEIAGEEHMECYCSAYRGVMYDGKRSVTACDAYEDAKATDS